MDILTPEEERALEFLKKYDFDVQRFSSSEKRHLRRASGEEVKLPDFKVTATSGEFFYCEVKSFQPTSENQSLSFNRFGRCIEDAMKQFDTVNSNLIVPNVLLWINYEPSYDVSDLSMIYTGSALMSDGTSVGGVQRLSAGRIKESKFKIDLHIWLDVDDGRAREDGLVISPSHHWFFSGATTRPHNYVKLVRLFKVDASNIQKL